MDPLATHLRRRAFYSSPKGLAADPESNLANCPASSINGRTVVATGNHPFWVIEGEQLGDRPIVTDLNPDERCLTMSGRWVQARHLKAGDQLLSRFASAARIQMLEVGRSICRVYNMQVEHLQAYAVGESAVLVHNKPAPNNEELPEPELPEGVGEAFADPADAIGDLQGQATHVGSGKTNPAQPSGQFWIDRGYTETHYFVDSNGDKWTLFFNRDTGLYSGGHLSSGQ